MILFFKELLQRNETLFYFGLANFIAALLFLVLSYTTSQQIAGVNAWVKPFKFALSTTLYLWAMAWFCHYLPNFNIQLFNSVNIILFTFEVGYIALQAYRGQLSHFNLSTPVYATLYSLMALAATSITLYGAYVGILFFSESFPSLPSYYVWAIRLGILIFVIFSFEGFVMGSKLTHTIGGADGGAGLPLLNWSTKYGDPRVAHFIGMHALQILPLLAFYVFKNDKSVFAISILYGLLALFTLIQALKGKPFIKNNTKIEQPN